VLFAALVVAGACLGPSTALASGVWSAPDKIGTGLGFVSVSCSSATFCAAVGTNGGPSGYALTYNGTSWSPTYIGIAAGAVSCASASFCVAVDGKNALTYTTATAPKKHRPAHN